MKASVLRWWNASVEFLRLLIPWRRRIKVQRVDDEPARANPNVLYVIEDAGRRWSAMLVCPGGCGQRLHMNLLPDTKPVWKLVVHADQTVTMNPSIWRREGCGCHFCLVGGVVKWV